MQETEVASLDEVLSVVSGAASQDPQLVTSSTKCLKELLLLPGTFDFLSQITVQRNVPLSMRQQSIIQLKNASLPHWKSRRLLTDEQRSQIRTRTMVLLEEEDATIAECNTVILSKIARIDYPANWPNLLLDLVAFISNNFERYISSSGSDGTSLLFLRRGLTALNRMIKEFCSIKMPAGIKVTGELLKQLQPFLRNIYSTLSSTFESQLTPANIATEKAGDVLQLAHVAYKCLSKLIAWLWHRLSINSYKELALWAEEFFTNSATQLRILYDLRTNLALELERPSYSYSKQLAERTVDSLTRHVRHLGKFFRRLQQLSVARFIVLPSCNDLVLYYWDKVVHAVNGPSTWISDSPHAVYPTQLLVQGMVLFKESLSQWTPTKHGENGEAALSREFVERAVRLLVTRFLLLSDDDLTKWSDDPEDWENDESVENDHWEFEPRACAERVLMTLANQYRDYVAPLLVALFEEYVGQRALTLENIVQKEAIYCAIGRCAIRLRGLIPFESWVTQTLKAEALETQQSYVIIKRRIAWLLGRWLSDECTSPNNPVIWEILIHFITDRGTGSDIAVRLASATALMECVNANPFEPDLFLPYLPSTMEQLVQLSADAESFEGKRRVMNSLNVLIEKMQHRVVPHNGILIGAIPQLWLGAGVNYIFKASMLTTVDTAVIASKECAYILNSIALPLVQESLTVPDARTHLDEDALKLWHDVIMNAIGNNSNSELRQLFELFPILTTLLSNNLDLLGSVLDIVESYIFLDINALLQAYATDLFRAFVRVINQATTPNIKNLVITLQYVFQLAPGSLWAEPMHVSGLFPSLLLLLKEEKGSTNIRTEVILAFARMAIADAQLFAQLMSATAAAREYSEESLWSELLDQWWRRFDNLSEPRNRKLVAMGIACLVATGRKDVLGRLNGEIFNLWLDVFGEIKEALAEAEEGGDDQVKALWLDAEFDRTSKAGDTEGTPEYERRKLIYENDVVKTEKLTSYISQRLQHAQSVYGMQQFQRDFLDDADAAVLKQLQDELSSQ